MLKTCYKCKKDKDLECFAVKTKNKDGRALECKECKNKYNKGYYAKNSDIHKQNVRKNSAVLIKRNTDYVNQIKKERGCKYCPEKEVCCLQFHHLRDKDKSISRLIANLASLERIDAEIQKCEVVCANCHFKIHNRVRNMRGDVLRS